MYPFFLVSRPRNQSHRCLSNFGCAWHAYGVLLRAAPAARCDFSVSRSCTRCSHWDAGDRRVLRGPRLAQEGHCDSTEDVVPENDGLD